MTQNELNILRANCLINASSLLSESVSDDNILIEAVNDNETKEIKDIKEACKSKDPNKIQTALKKFINWFGKVDPNKKHLGVWIAIKILLYLIPYIISGINFIDVDLEYGIKQAMQSRTGLKLISKKDTIKLISSIVLFISSAIIPSLVDNSIVMKLNSKDAEKNSENLFNEAKRIKDTMDKLDDKNSKEYKELNKLYARTLNCANTLKAIAKQNDVKDKLKEAKKSKDKNEIKAAKMNLNNVKNGVYESAMRYDDLRKYMSLTESANILLEEASVADNLEDAQELIEKAKELQEKAIDMIDDTTEKLEDKKDCKDGKCADKEVVQECIDRLLEAAVMCEEAEDAAAYIEKAEELQKAIDDIPEEDPEIDDEYPEDISGGNGEREDYLEDIKDLVDGDKDAINILTVDENSLTIG